MEESGSGEGEKLGGAPAGESEHGRSATSLDLEPEIVVLYFISQLLADM